MTADLRLVDAETTPGPPGSADLEDAFYYYRSQIDSPSTAGIFRTDYSAEGGGSIRVHFSSQLGFVQWSRFLGFDIQQETRGKSLLSSAVGAVQFRGRHYAVALICTRFSDTGDQLA